MVQWLDRQGNPVPGEDGQNRALHFLYNTKAGGWIVSVMIRPWVSNLAGKLMDSGISRIAIRTFAKKNRIDLSQYEDRKYHSFNDFFTRKIRPELRPVDMEKRHLIAPCDSKLSVYPITDTMQVQVKGAKYTLQTLLRDPELAKRFEGGWFLLLRLTKDDYHRYCYVDDGVKGENVRIPGVYHTVNPIAGEHYRIYRENTREYSLLESENFGSVLMMEVGAAMVGRIVNHHGAQQVLRGQEKGLFEFGGSTVILCMQKDRVLPDEDLLRNTANGAETVVRQGERIGIAV